MHLNDPEHIDHDLIARAFSNEASSEELHSLELWKEMKPEHQAYFDKLHMLWQDTGKIEAVLPALVNLDQAWKRVNARTAPITKTIAPGIPAVFKYAAVFLLLAAVAISLVLLQQENINYQNITASENTLIQKLSDGSEVSLKQFSSLSYPETFSSAERIVELKGEAFFDITKNSEKPFIIESGELRIKVLGTSFFVNANEAADSALVIVETGVVEVSKGTESITLNAGESGVYYYNNKLLKKLNENNIDPNLNYWKHHRLTFRHKRLDKVLLTLNDIYDVNIQMGDPALKKCKLSATFNNEKLENILDVIISTFNLQRTDTNNQILLNGEGC